MGFVAIPDLGHYAVALGVQALARLAHRGGLDADGKSGDGAGLLIQVPEKLLGGRYAVCVVFDWDERARELVERHLRVAVWRAVPLDVDSLGARARETMPASRRGGTRVGASRGDLAPRVGLGFPGQRPRAARPSRLGGERGADEPCARRVGGSRRPGCTRARFLSLPVDSVRALGRSRGARV